MGGGGRKIVFPKRTHIELLKIYRVNSILVLKTDFWAEFGNLCFEMDRTVRSIQGGQLLIF